MHIKKLEIAGFKSFVDRTVIHFDHDVIGIVGPNGCGKSNIVDAVRWCMGEQSPKHLRGSSMSDVIFNGSESRAPHGLAEVTITFDNTDVEYAASLPPEFRDFAEIAVTRRLFRDGTSEYLINKTQVRLRDVTELFLGTGVGTKAYSIIEQGRIGMIVSARPEDRRRFIEEAAGITKYRARRKEAERKMDQTRQNLLRVNDIVGELDRNRGALKRQVAKAERFIEYRRELEDLSLHEASHRYLEITVIERVQRDERDGAASVADASRAALATQEAELETARDEGRALEERADAASRAAFDADNEVSRIHAEIERARDRLVHLSARLGAAASEQTEITQRLADHERDRAELTRRLCELTEEEAARDGDAASEAEALVELTREQQRADGAARTERARAAELERNIAAESARLEAHVARRADLVTRRDRVGAELERLDAELADLAVRRATLERAVGELVSGKQTTVAEREQLESELAELRGRQLESERAADAAKNELNLRKNRLRALEELHRRLEGVGAGAKALVAQGDAAVLGLVADRIEAPAHLTGALAGLLGRELEAVVVTDPERGLALLDELGRSERGRATIVSARPRYVAGRAEPGGGALRLADELSYAPADEALVRALVGDAVVLPDAPAALAWCRSHPGGTAVTPSGTVVRADGTISGGKGDEVGASMVEQKRELRSLGLEVERLTPLTAQLLADHQALRSRLTEVSTALDAARQAAHQGELAHKTAEMNLTRAAADAERVAARRAAVEREIAEASQGEIEVEQLEQSTRASLDALEASLGTTREALAVAQQTAEQWTLQVNAQSSLVTERKVRLAQVREQLGGARESEARVLAAIDDLSTRGARLDLERTEAAIQHGETAALLWLGREARLVAQRTAKLAHRELGEARDLVEKVRRALGIRDAELKMLRDDLSLLDERVRKAEVALARLGSEREHLLAGVRQRFRGLHLPRVVGDYHRRLPPDEEHRRRIDELTQLIDRMGPVNLDARAEYEEAETRFSALNDQKVDIEQALIELEKSIRHMDRESKRRFRETFEAVNDLFKKTFAKMFRGGRAELRLTDPENLLETGVDIIAQPPGKNLASIELMSGGEKALTAVSLIFAIFQYRPSPFCVLDEVDAPLDEANVTRYNEAIRAMTDRSQFILITHIKKTMQSVDVLYGVTMGEPGVSRIVSVKVNEKAVSRSETRATRVEAPDAEAKPAVA